ncbi:Fic family protein [Pectobacterium brasiliense]|uniref:Fic family protein n=1 Tax=Pectobacterium brasiliense TaxID=180957 RepID=A0AAW9HGR1_9GAMM|nr:Fic family protein [Pectobacterium brasiliense]MDY4379643.1 Fic family protein [Pectobacterium brasiliense]
MSLSPPDWQAHNAVGYNSIMISQCEKLLTKIVADPACRQAVLSDPRSLHRELFEAFAPPGYSEYAGSYRGMSGSSLAYRRVFAYSQITPRKRYEFDQPSEVSAGMNLLLRQTRDLIGDKPTDDFDKLIALSYTFCHFGKIHPFLDGNGHVQRAIFAAMATEFGIPLSARFAIHPRPYDRLLAIALEIFTCAPGDQKNGELGLVAEYLGFFLEGPFNAPRKHIGTETPYT